MLHIDQARVMAGHSISWGILALIQTPLLRIKCPSDEEIDYESLPPPTTIQMALRGYCLKAR